jgi:hypothetical protein
VVEWTKLRLLLLDGYAQNTKECHRFSGKIGQKLVNSIGQPILNKLVKTKKSEEKQPQWAVMIYEKRRKNE